ncbi:hypothetical protein [Streptomyces fumanus]|nr:hypothetical protein [Streptomyces fumanus]
MKKRSMLALASLATGFVVAAVTPSHAGAEAPARPGTAVDALDAVADAPDHLTPLDHDERSGD